MNKKYKAIYKGYAELEIEAENEDEAYEIAGDNQDDVCEINIYIEEVDK